MSRELSSLSEEVEMCLGRFFASGKLFETSIFHETHCRIEIPSNVTDRKDIMKVVDDIFRPAENVDFA